ncbi:MAG TPA: alpha/beta hydrolase [Fibrobacteres bacterium]|jgi:acetyl esterase/lipase|nr:alpha/beta hydrolase [Fibrobacterota bacterium]
MSITFTVIRLSVATAVFLASLLTVVPAPVNFLWKLSIVVLEAGYWLVVPCILLALWCFGSGTYGKISGLLFLCSAILLASPLIRAWQSAYRLEREYHRGFGKRIPESTSFHRTRILSWKDLLLGIQFPAVKPQRRVYSHHEGDSLEMNFYAARRPSAPCIVIIHGGGWDGGDREQLPALNSYFASLGYAVASLDYRLAPEHRYPAPVQDVRDALTFLHTHATDMNIDASRIILLGRSAGGQIALQAAYTLKDPSIKGVISFYGPADMVFGYSLPGNPWLLDSRKLMEQYLGGSYMQHPQAYHASSPVEALNSTSPPTLLLHGHRDVLVSYQHTVHMEMAMSRRDIPHFTVDLPWATHGYDYVFSGPGSQIGLYFMERFLSEVSK